MIIRSFRVRFMLWNILCSGAVLGVFGASAWWLSYRVGLVRLDGEIRETARREIREAVRPEYWERSQHPWRSAYGGGPEHVQMALLIRERGDTNILLRTTAWPKDLQPDVFADPELPPEDAERPRGEASDRPPRLGDGRPPPPGAVVDGLPGLPGFFPPPLGMGAFATLRQDGGDWRFGIVGNRDLTFLVGVPLKPLQDELDQLARILVAAFLPGLLLIAASGWILTGRALRPVRSLTKTAEGITARGLDRRLPVTREAEEFNRLADVFNGMLDRLEKSFRQATRFSADAAHELKTPLAILQGQLEESLREAADDPRHQRLCAGLLEEVQRLKNIVRKLLLLSLADAGELRIQSEKVDLTALVNNAAEDAGILAPGLRLDVRADSSVSIPGDPDLLAQVVQNLVGNAIKYNVDHGFIRMELESRPGGIRLAVTNSGPPIQAEAQSRLFERFYRGDPSRTRAVEGAGLGLSLSREIARAHGGDLILERSDDAGTTFTLTLPR